MITNILIGLNVLVYILLGIGGDFLGGASSETILRWGGNTSYLIMEGQWWRLLSCLFLHCGLMHLLVNMYALFSVGSFLELMLGRALFLVAYLATGICSGLASFLYYQDTLAVSVGASGAIAGVFGVSLFIILFGPLPGSMREQALKSVVYVILMNVGYGLVSGRNLDHSAHIGGFVSGFVMGAFLFPTLAIHRMKKVWLKWVCGGGTLAVTCALMVAILVNQTPSDKLIFLRLFEKYQAVEEEVGAFIRNKEEVTFAEICLHIVPKLKEMKEFSAQVTALELEGGEKALRDYCVRFIDLRDQKLSLVLKGSRQYEGKIAQIEREMASLDEKYAPYFE